MALSLALRLRYLPPVLDYAALHASLVARYAPPLDASAWHEIRLLLAARICAWLNIDPWRAEELDGRLVARIGPDWYSGERVADVVQLLKDFI